MEGFLFFWLAWSGWIFFTFIMEKDHPARFPLAALVSLVIILAKYSFSLGPLEISWAVLLLLPTGFFYYRKRRFRELVTSGLKILIITAFATAFFILSVYDPVWIFLDIHWMQTILFAPLSLLLFHHFGERFVATMIGFIQADFLFSLLLANFGLHHPVLSLSFFDGLSLLFAVLSVWSGLENLHQSFGNPVRHGRGKGI